MQASETSSHEPVASTSGQEQRLGGTARLRQCTAGLAVAAGLALAAPALADVAEANFSDTTPFLQSTGEAGMSVKTVFTWLKTQPER